MSVCTKGFVATDFKDVLVVCTIAEAALKRLIGARRRAEFPGATLSSAARARFQNPQMELAPSSGMVRFAFTCDGEQRTMTLFMACDVDNRKHAPKSISLSMGAEGGSETYMRCVLHALSAFGPAWLDANDSDDIPAAPLDLPRPTLMGLMAMGQLSPYDFEHMRETLLDASRGDQRAFLETVGCTNSQARQFEDVADSTERWDAMRAFAKAVTAVANEPVHARRRLRA